MVEPQRYVQARSRQDIEHLAASIRQAMQLGDGRVGMLPLLELAMPDILEGYEFRVVPDDQMPGAEGLTDLRDPILRFPQSVYDELRAGDPRARFTAAHEFGHLLMHSASTVHYARSEKLRDEVDPEWQANEFAAAFLMPTSAFRTSPSVEAAMERFGVGYLAAMKRAKVLRHRFKFTNKKGRKSMTHAP